MINNRNYKRRKISGAVQMISLIPRTETVTVIREWIDKLKEYMNLLTE